MNEIDSIDCILLCPKTVPKHAPSFFTLLTSFERFKENNHVAYQLDSVCFKVETKIIFIEGATLFFAALTSI